MPRQAPRLFSASQVGPWESRAVLQRGVLDPRSESSAPDPEVRVFGRAEPLWPPVCLPGMERLPLGTFNRCRWCL